MGANKARAETIPFRRGPEKKNFTVAVLNGIEPPAEGRLYVYDARTSGLAFCVTAAGARTFYVYRRVEGIPKRYKIGKFPAITIEQARTAALDYHHKVDVVGIDPQEERRQKRSEWTLGKAWEDYCNHRPSEPRTAATISSDRSRWNKWLADWSGRRLSAIRKADVKILHGHIAKPKKDGAINATNANRVIQLLRRIFNHAIDEAELKLVNPVNVHFFSENERERTLNTDELPRYFAALQAEPDDVLRDFFELCLWTGARKSNVLQMCWDEINLELMTWTIPAAKFKSRRRRKREASDMKVPLSPEAMKILTRRKAETQSEWVFPGRGKTGHLVEPKLAWQRLLDRAKISDLHLHDLRRTFGSWQAHLGASLPIIGKSLGHSRPETTQIYARLQIDPVRASVNAATAAISKAGKKGKVKRG